MREATLADMRLIPMRIRHLGTDRSPEVLAGDARLPRRAGRRGAHRVPTVARILADDGRVTGVELADGDASSRRDAVIAAPGSRGRRLARGAGARARHRAREQRRRHRRARRGARRR